MLLIPYKSNAYIIYMHKKIDFFFLNLNIGRPGIDFLLLQVFALYMGNLL